MEKLRLEQADDRPFVLLDKDKDRFEISGKSLPEDVIEFYLPILNWLRDYKHEPAEKTVFNFKLIYFNTASSKLILDILIILQEIKESGKDVLVRWHALKSDEDMQKAGEEYEEMVELPFELLTYEF